MKISLVSVVASLAAFAVAAPLAVNNSPQGKNSVMANRLRMPFRLVQMTDLPCNSSRRKARPKPRWHCC
jgi:hypothetical protein